MTISTNNALDPSSGVANAFMSQRPAQTGSTTKGMLATAANETSGTGSSTSTSTTSAGDISSTDFLTLLVSELKNQDPTQPTDPNQYVQQLVGVNSLQQLISINQELGTATTGTSTSNSSISATPSTF